MHIRQRDNSSVGLTVCAIGKVGTSSLPSLQSVLVGSLVNSYPVNESGQHVRLGAHGPASTTYLDLMWSYRTPRFEVMVPDSHSPPSVVSPGDHGESYAPSI